MHIVHIICLCLAFIFNNISVLADPPYSYCPDGNNNNTSNARFQNNSNSLLISLPSNASLSKFQTISFGEGNTTVYGLYLCYDYVKLENCRASIIMATQAMTRICPSSTDAVIWEEISQVHLSNKKFFGELDLTVNISKYNAKLAPEPEKFKSAVNDSLYDLAKAAAYNSSVHMYATQSVAFLNSQRIYSLVQCTPDLSPNDCYRCLQFAIIEVLSLEKYKCRGGRLLSKSCYLRYEFYAFYEGKASEDREEHKTGGKKSKKMIILFGLACLTLLLVGTCVFYFTLKRRNIGFRGRPSTVFDLASILIATDNFSNENKLGEGGFGPVFKGILRDGTKVAVKRLTNLSVHRAEEFTNEVLLIMRLQHRNLVRLLGFCVQEAERLLVFELMSSGSLDSWLHDPQKRTQLTWSKRFDIINGVAQGILYLHEDSRLRIIHRDMKPSNVLLDSDLNPKISDFGIARIYGSEEASTATVIGTYGYMAPEYAMEGIYSVKSDVFSFGVILLEVITGRRSIGFHLSGKGPSLQAYAWRLWSQNRWKEIMAPQFKSNLSEAIANEILRCLHIGLLCVQEDSCERPTMSMVIHMLKSENISLQPPKQPAFSIGRFGDHYETSPRVSTSLRYIDLADISGR